MTLIQLLDEAWPDLEWAVMGRNCSNAYHIIVVFRNNKWFS